MQAAAGPTMTVSGDREDAMAYDPPASADGWHYLEDLAVGDRFSGGRHALDAAQIKAFAAQFDPQPFHLDEAAAADTLFGGLAASGWHTAALTMKLIVGGALRPAGGMIGAAAELAWPTPARAGDVLDVESVVESVTPSRSQPGRGVVVVRTTTRNQHGDVLQTMTARLIVRRRPVPDAV
jgi:acyl dehydratase